MPEAQLPLLDLGESPRLEQEGRVWTKLRVKKAWDVLRMLAETQGQWRSRDELSWLLWPDSPPNLARQSLRQALVAIKQGLPGSGDWLEQESGSLRLHSEKVQVKAAPSPVPMFSWTRPDPDLIRQEFLGQAPLLLARGQWGAVVARAEEIEAISGRPDSEVEMFAAEAKVHAWRASDAIADLDRLEEAGNLSPALYSRLHAARGHALLQLDQTQAGRLAAVSAIRTAPQGRRDIQLNALRALLAAAIEQSDVALAEKASDAIRRLAPASPSRWSLLARYGEAWIDCASHRPGANRASAIPGEELASARSHPGLFGILIARFGRLAEHVGEDAEAGQRYLQTLDALADTDCLAESAEVHTYLGEMRRRSRKLDESLESFKQAARARQQMRNSRGLATALRGVGVTLLEMGCLADGWRQLQVAEEVFIEARIPVGAATCQFWRANAAERMGHGAQSSQLMGQAMSRLGPELAGPGRLHLPEDILQAVGHAV